jgi:hypothetical protein
LGLEIQKPADLFANDFLSFLKPKIPGDWTRTDWKIKVLYWKGESWNEAAPIARSLNIGNPNEYANRPDISTEEGWQKIDSFSVVPPTGLPTTSRETALLQHNFPLPLAEQLAPFDALVILNNASVQARFKARIPFPDHELIAHEVFHIAEQLSRKEKQMEQWDNTQLYESPEIEKLFEEFIEGIGNKEFAKRYFMST